MHTTVCLQAEANSPEQFVRMLLREKTSCSFINDVLAIYTGEVITSCFLGSKFCQTHGREHFVFQTLFSRIYIELQYIVLAYLQN